MTDKTLTQQLKAITEKKQALQAKKVEAEKITMDYQDERDKAEVAETDLDMQYMISPDEELAIKLKDARINTERCIRQYEQALKTLRNIPGSIQKLNTEEKIVSAEKAVLASALIKKKLSAKKLADIEKKAQLGIAQYLAARTMATSRQLSSVSLSTHVFDTLNKDRMIIKLMAAEFKKLNEQLRLEDI